MPADGEWHQYTVVKSGSGANNGTLYIDGVKVGSGQLSDAISGTSLRIGRDHRIDNSSDQTNYWDGAISDLRVWNRSLSAPEIAAAIDDSASLSGYEANLVAWYALSGDANNQATSNWNLGRDYDPRSSAAAQGGCLHRRQRPQIIRPRRHRRSPSQQQWRADHDVCRW